MSSCFTITTSILFIILILIFLSIYIIISSRITNKRLYNIAFIDEITELWNYNYFRIKGKEYINKYNEENIILIYFDIDKFKLINDKYEYEYGNKVLKEIGSTIKEIFVKDSVFCRSCNNDFFILCKYNGTMTNVKQIVESLSDKIHMISLDDDENLDIKPSIGVYIILKEDTSIETCIDRAGIAKYQVKGNRINTYALYDVTLRDKLIEEKEMERDMENAILEKEFQIYLQPKYNMSTNSIVGSEALIRWNHPQKGMISPNKFIPLFETNKFIEELDLFVFEDICKLIKRWIDQNTLIYPISINVSRVSLQNENLIDKFIKLVNKYEIEYSIIQIEITESAIFENEGELVQVINRLRDLGFKVSIDDFGAGYSSLNMLKNISVDEIKLDRAFLYNIKDENKSRIILLSIINMAHMLNISIVSEGIETEEQKLYLNSIGCDIGQGYIYSRPITIKEYEYKIRNTK